MFSDQVLVDQIHDFNPGISSNGVFWTAAIPRGSVHVSPGSGRATMNVTDLEVIDAIDIVNALSGGPTIPATVSFECSWGGTGDRVSFSNADAGFAGTYVHNSATLQWSGSNSDGYEFTSDPFGTGFAVVGKSRNGIFAP